MREILEKGLTETGLGTSCIPALEEFSRLLLEKNKVMNLTAITEPADAAGNWEKASWTLAPGPVFRGCPWLSPCRKLR